MGPPSLRNGLIYLIIIAAIGAFLLTSISRNSQTAQQVEVSNLNQVAQQIEAGKVKAIEVNGDELQIQYNDDSRIGTSRKEEGVSLTKTLSMLGVTQNRFRTSISPLPRPAAGPTGASFLAPCYPFC